MQPLGIAGGHLGNCFMSAFSLESALKCFHSVLMEELHILQMKCKHKTFLQFHNYSITVLTRELGGSSCQAGGLVLTDSIFPRVSLGKNRIWFFKIFLWILWRVKWVHFFLFFFLEMSAYLTEIWSQQGSVIPRKQQRWKILVWFVFFSRDLLVTSWNVFIVRWVSLASKVRLKEAGNHKYEKTGIIFF